MAHLCSQLYHGGLWEVFERHTLPRSDPQCFQQEQDTATYFTERFQVKSLTYSLGQDTPSRNGGQLEPSWKSTVRCHCNRIVKTCENLSLQQNTVYSKISRCIKYTRHQFQNTNSLGLCFLQLRFMNLKLVC